MIGLSARFLVPASARWAWLVSDSSRPRDVGVSPDPRHLGVQVSELAIQDGLEVSRTVPLDDPSLGTGFYGPEGAGAETVRWTNGTARLPASLWDGCQGQFFLRVKLGRAPLPRWIHPNAEPAPVVAAPKPGRHHDVVGPAPVCQEGAIRLLGQRATTG